MALLYPLLCSLKDKRFAMPVHHLRTVDAFFRSALEVILGERW